uniref:General transcription factor 3C polypeptide 3 n=1 Tax=Chenopodium quinoa TaxID=63459 RepID=A0A803KM38_CHEQI
MASSIVLPMVVPDRHSEQPREGHQRSLPVFLQENEEVRGLMEGKEDGNVDDDVIEEEGSTDGDDEMEEGEDCFVGFEANKNSLDCEEDGGGGEEFAVVVMYCFLFHDGDWEVSDKKPGNGVSIGATLEEMDVIYTCYGRWKRSRKPKKRGRLKGSRNKLSPEIEKKLGDAALHYAYGCFKDAINILLEVVQIAPNISDTYHTLGLVHNSMGDKHKAMDFYSIAAIMNPKESSVWKQLVNWSIYQRASLYMEKGEHLNAAKAYNEIVQMCPKNVEALKTATKLHKQCGQIDQSISMLEDYLKQSSEADLTVVDVLALLCMGRNEFMRALQHIENVKVVCCRSGKEFPLCLKISEGVCHAHLGNTEKAKVCFSLLQRENAEHQMDLIMAVANSFQNLNQHESALKYYMMLEGCLANSELVNLKIAHCYSALNRATSAIYFFFTKVCDFVLSLKVLQAREDDIDTRLALVSHLLVENREDEAIALLLPPSNTELSNEMDEDRHEPWWDNVKVKLKLSDIYRSKWMLEAFVAVIHPIILESLKIDPLHQKLLAYAHTHKTYAST